jgi:hypothetical protein
VSSIAPEGRVLRLALLSIAAGVGTAIVCAIWKLGWLPPTLVNPLIVAAFIAAAVRQRDPALRALCWAGGGAALLELLIADPSFVSRDILVYERGGPFVVDSPLYMPISWVYIVVQMGVIALWMVDRWGLARASGVMAVVGAINGPGYEWMAQYADWWIYQKTWLIGGVPVFVIASEGAIGAVLPLMATQVVRRPPWLAFTIGAGLGVFMWGAAQVAFALLGRP